MAIDIRTQPLVDVAPFLASRLAQALSANKKVLWLLSGGSSADVCVEASKLLEAQGVSRDALYMAVSDERYGEVGHADENTQLLLDKGLVVGAATLYRPLQGVSRAESATRFATWLTQIRATADYAIVVLGIGPDGHASGIKPHTRSVTSTEAAVDYTGEDFERITTTPAFLATFDEAVIQIYGEAKHPMLSQLLTTETPLMQQPAQLAKSIPRVTLFTDYQ